MNCVILLCVQKKCDDCVVVMQVIENYIEQFDIMFDEFFLFEQIGDVVCIYGLIMVIKKECMLLLLIMFNGKLYQWIKMFLDDVCGVLFDVFMFGELVKCFIVMLKDVVCCVLMIVCFECEIGVVYVDLYFEEFVILCDQVNDVVLKFVV